MSAGWRSRAAVWLLLSALALSAPVSVPPARAVAPPSGEPRRQVYRLPEAGGCLSEDLTRTGLRLPPLFQAKVPRGPRGGTGLPPGGPPAPARRALSGAAASAPAGAAFRALPTVLWMRAADGMA